MADKKVVIEYTERWTNGGIEKYILEILGAINKKKFEVRIVVAQKETMFFDSILKEQECKVECILPLVCEHPIKRSIQTYFRFRSFLEQNPCDILHLHICQGIAMSYARIAKKIGIKKVIVHSHNTQVGEGNRVIKLLGHHVGKMIYRKYADEKIACSDLASKWLFSKKDIKSSKVKIFKCLVDIDKYAYDEQKRKEMRLKYQVDNSCVYLSIGRMNYQKNQLFLLDIFREILKFNLNSILILIGTGELKKEIYSYSVQQNLDNNIIFVEKTSEVEKYLFMADYFILPSLFEGNPIVGIEAQASGLPCFFSDSISKQAKVLDSCEFISLKESASAWAKKIYFSEKTYTDRGGAHRIMKEFGYERDKQISEIECLYENCLN